MELHEFHRQTAETLTNTYATHESPPDGWRDVVLWHWEQSGEYVHAVRVALQSVELSLEIRGFHEASRWMGRVIGLLETHTEALGDQHIPLRLHAYTLFVSILEFHGQYREAYRYAQQLQQLADSDGTGEMQANSALIMGRVRRELGDLTAAQEQLTEALVIAERHSVHDIVAECHFQLAKVHQLQGRHLEAFQQLELAHHATTADHARLARIWTGIGDGYRVLGAGREGLRLYKRALKLEVDTDNRFGQAILHEKLGLTYASLAQPDRALEHAWMALQLRQGLNDTLGIARSHATLGIIQKGIGEYERAVKHFEQARDLEEQLQNQRGHIIALTSLGDVAWLMGEHQYAHDCFQEALDLAQKIDDQVALARISERLGDTAHQRGEQNEAERYWRDALQIREQLGHSEEAKAIQTRFERPI